MFVALAMSVLAGYGASWLLTHVPRRVRALIVSLLIAVVAVESRNKTIQFTDLPDRAPIVYRWLSKQPPGVVWDYPLGDVQGRVGPQDPTYEYYSTKHWLPLVNGYSGFAPAQYYDLQNALRSFPADSAIAALKARNVRYLLVHSAFYIRDEYGPDVATLRSRRDMTYVGTFPWRDGSQTAAFLLGR
jgi:hypothetical protein